MAKLPDRGAAAMSETVSYFKNPIELTIDWTIHNFSSLKSKRSATYSKRTVIGTSTWSVKFLLALPSTEDEKREGALFNGTGVHITHDSTGSRPQEVTAQFRIR